ncbi:MAG TPA: sigma-54 dependent transcriptional regulator [Pirellulaceae bacterium]|jgi:DNA-binding NtrC family response regulator|nr:sigma-54 dependent transcriptional regulator [Pirellulaceae bacterium]
MKRNKGRLLLVDDDRYLLDSMVEWLASQGYQVYSAWRREQALQIIAGEELDVVVTDVRLEEGDGFEILAAVKEMKPELPVILMTGYGNVDTAVEAMRDGAFDLLTKPLIDEELELALSRALSQKRVLAENKSLKTQLDRKYGLEHVVGTDPRMQKIFDMIDAVADTRATILITGESGTGKSLLARAIHRRSSRASQSFVEVACGALPETLLESELFGHVAGSFTGATGEKIGRFLQADRGTIFLDEIGTASPGLQVKLLRVLQEFEFEPVGGTKTHRVDSRVILATNENLENAVRDGRFRQDLYYRVNVINLELPSLRDRPSDIPLLVERFLRGVVEETGKRIDGFSDEAVHLMQTYRWPGNVRELQNVVERAVLLGRGPRLEADDLPTHLIEQPREATPGRPVISTSSRTVTLKEALEEPERRIILDVLKSFRWNRNATADALGINRTTLYKKMKRLGLEDPRRPDYQPDEEAAVR